MEIKGKDPESGLEHGDVRMPETTDTSLSRRSRARVFLHLTGIGIGLFLLLIGLGLGLTRSHWDRLALIPIIVGAALLLGWVTVNHDFLVRMMKNRRVMVGANAVFMGLLAVVLLVMANFVAYRHYRKWDTTIAGRFTLSPKTEQVLDNLKDDVTVVVVEMKKYRTGQEETVALLRELLSLYKELNPRVTVTFLQPDADPAGAQIVAEKYQISLTTAKDLDNVYVISGDKRKVVRLSEMMDYERDPNNPMRTRATTFKGEQYVTSALIEVTSKGQPKIYFLTGHGEADMADPGPGGMMQLVATLKRDNILVETMAGIPGSGVPADCEALVVLGPKARFDDREIERLRRYLDRGGRLLLAEDVGVITGLEPFIAEYGIEIRNNAVIAEAAAALAGSAATFGAVEYSDHPISAPLRGYATIWSLARTVSAVPDPAMRYNAMELVRTTAGAYAETDLATLFSQNSSTRNPAEDKGGPLSLAAASEVRPAPAAEGQTPPKGARVVVFGDVEAFSNAILPLPYKNVDLFRNAVNWLLERQDLIAIEERPQTQHILVVDDPAKAAVFYILVVGLPVLVLLLGAFVWAVRSYGSRQK